MKRILLLLITASLGYTQNYEIYVSDAANFTSPPWQILKYDQNGESPSVFIFDQLRWPQDILFLEDYGVVLISNLSSGRITRHDVDTGAYLSNFATGVEGPTRMAIGPDSLLYVLQWNGAGNVRRYTLTGTYLGEFTTVGVPRSIGLDWDSNKNLYVSSYNGDYVRKYDSLGVDLGLFIDSDLLGPTNVWFDSNGDLLVSDYNGSAVKRFNSEGDFQGNFISGLSQSEGVAYLPDGNILIGNGATHSVKMFDSLGTYLEDLIPSGSGGLLTPNAVVIRPLQPVSVGEDSKSPVNFILSQNYPNPFNPSTTLRYALPKTSDVSIIIYDVTGRAIMSHSGSQTVAGWHAFQWNGVDDRGERVSPGIYLARIQAGTNTSIIKMTLIK